MVKILKETEMNLYNNCDRLDCDDCFGVVHKGRIMRCGFETITFMRQKKIEKSKKKVTLKRKFSCNGLNMRKNTFMTYKRIFDRLSEETTSTIQELWAHYEYNLLYFKNAVRKMIYNRFIFNIFIDLNVKN